MLRLIEDASQIGKIFPENDLFMTKIISNMMTYEGNGINTWVQDDNACVQYFDGHATVWANDQCDKDELKKLLKMSGCKYAFTSPNTAKSLGLSATSGGIIMKKRSYTSPVSSGFKPPPFPEYTKIYDLLKNCDFKLPKKDDFIADLSYRRHKGTARIVANNDYSAVAFTAFETERSAIISAVAVDESHRRMGLGSKILASLCEMLENDNKDIYLYRDYDKNESFYNQNAFYPIGEFVNCVIK